MSLLNRVYKKSELVFFLILLCFTASFPWWNDAWMSFDGPMHTYNAGLMQLYHHDLFVRTFLKEQPFILPNFLSHVLLKWLLVGVDSLTAEKIIVSALMVSWACSFRWLIKTLTGTVPYLSVLIFPLLLNNLVYMGFYNFNLGFTFFNLHLIFLSKALNHSSRKAWLLVTVSAVVLYYSHLMGFALGVVAGLLLLVTQSATLQAKKTALLQYAWCVLPAALIAVVFFLTVNVPSFDYDSSFYEKVKAWVKFDPIITYNGDLEGFYGQLFALLLAVLLVLTLWRYIREKKSTPVFFILFVLMVVASLTFKNGALSGMFTARALLTGFYFLVIAVALDAKGMRFLTIPVALLIGVIQYQVTNLRQRDLAQVQTYIQDIKGASKVMKDHSLVQTIRLSDDTYSGNYGAHAVSGRPIILLENYEANIAWFPLNWRSYMTDLLIDQEPIFSHLKVDYVLVYGTDYRVKDRFSPQLLQYMQKNMKRIYQSADTFCTVYGWRNQPVTPQQ